MKDDPDSSRFLTREQTHSPNLSRITFFNSESPEKSEVSKIMEMLNKMNENHLKEKSIMKGMPYFLIKY